LLPTPRSSPPAKLVSIITDRLREVVRRVPLDRMLVETDSPYPIPVPHRGKRNEPAYVRYVGETIATVKGLSLEEVARVTTQNVRQLFGI
jgi:TatD DNase family protein